MSRPPRRLFALDQNFPEPFVVSLADAFAEQAELVPLRAIDARLPGCPDDWRILLALHRHGRGFDGLITTDSGMLRLPRELAVLMQTRLTLVVAEAAGHDPLKATGLVLTHLCGVCRRTRRDRAQVWRLAARERSAEDPWEHMRRLAEPDRRTSDLYDEVKLTDRELMEDPLL